METVETNREMSEFIDEYYKMRPQLEKPKSNSFGTYDLPKWCYDVIYSLMNNTTKVTNIGVNYSPLNFG